MTASIIHQPTLVHLKAGGVQLAGELTMPAQASALVVLVDGDVSPLRSRRDAHVADALNDAGVATLLLDLLTEDEQVVDDKTRQLRLDVRLLAKRLIDVTDWLSTNPPTRAMPIGYFAADTSAAAALIGAAARPRAVGAIVCRGGRPDMAAAALPSVTSATLLLVGEHDRATIPLNEWALHRVSGPRELVLIDDATHLYESDRSLDEVCRLSTAWFTQRLAMPANDDAVPDPEC